MRLGSASIRIISAACLSLVILAATEFARNRISKKPVDTQQGIATIVESTNDVQRKPQKRIIWEEIGTGDLLHSGEEIRTYKNSQTRIRFLKSGTEIDLDPDSLVGIDENQGQIDINFVKGNLFVRSDSPEIPKEKDSETSESLKNPKEEVRLNVGNKKINIGNSDLAVLGGEKNNIEIQVTKGKATFEKDGKTQTLSESSQDTEESRIRITLPKNASKIWMNGNDPIGGVTFNWTPVDPRYEVYVDNETANPRITTPTSPRAAGNLGSLKVRFPRGRVKARLHATSKVANLPPLYSPFVFFNVEFREPPIPREPSNQSAIQLKDESIDQIFKWNYAKSLANIRLELSRSPKFEQILASYEAPGQPALGLPTHLAGEKAVSFKKSGIYYWRIAATLSSTNDRIYSEVREFTVRMQTDVIPPELISPTTNAKYIFEHPELSSITFTWKENAAAESYQLRVEPASGRNPSAEITTDVTGTSHTVRSLHYGTYRWRVAAISKDGTPSKPTAGEFEVLEPRPISWRDALGAEIKYPTDQPILDLAWENTDQNVKNWKLRFALQTENIANSKWQDFTEARAHLILSQQGVYNFEVQAIDYKGGVIGKSGIRKINIKPLPLLPAPNLVAGLGNPIRTLPDGSIRVSWNPVIGAKEYQIVLENGQGEPLLQEKSEKTDKAFTELLPGTYTLSIRTIDHFGRMSALGKRRTVVVPSENGMAAPKLKKIKAR